MIRIVTDSTPNLPPQVISEFGITVIPTHVYFGSESYLDGVDITASEFYKRLSPTAELPTTVQSSVDEFRALYERLLASAPDTTIISIHLSSSLSGFAESARGAAALLPDAKIRIFDTRSIALAHGLMVREAARMACEDASEADILKRLETMRDNIRIFWIFDTLEYLAKSGRIGRLARVMGGLLDLKPIVTIKDGALENHSKVRGRAAAIAALRDLVVKDAGGMKGVRLAVAHSACEDDAKRYADDIRAEINPEVFVFSELGPALGVYTGPGVVGTYWWVPDRTA